MKFVSTSGHVIYCVLYKHTNDNVFDDFLEDSGHFPKNFQNCFEGLTNVSEHFPKMFRSYSNTSKYFLRDYVAKGMVIFRFVKIMLFLRVK